MSPEASALPTGPALRFEYSLVFKGYERQDARLIREIVPSSLPGVGPEDLSQRLARAPTLL